MTLDMKGVSGVTGSATSCPAEVTNSLDDGKFALEMERWSEEKASVKSTMEEEDQEDPDDDLLKIVQMRILQHREETLMDESSCHSASSSRTRGSWVSLFLSAATPHRVPQTPVSLTPRGPGAFSVAPDGNINPPDIPEPEAQTDLEMVELQHARQHPPLDDSQLVQAWPASTPLASAIPYQGTLNNHITMNRRRLKLVVLGVLAFVAAVFASSTALPLLLEQNDPNNLERMQIKSAIVGAFGKDYFDSPQKERALHWIAYEDPRHALGIQEESHHVTNLIQRFALVSFYFQTSVQQPWTNCNPPVDKQLDLCYHFKSDILGSQNEIAGTRWLTAAHECQWMGVNCQQGTRTVSALSLFRNNITGTIPAEELAILSQLQILSLSTNSLTGTVPKRLFECFPLLQKINLSKNKLTGSIPSQAFLMPSLEVLSLRANQLSSSIATEIGLFNGTTILLGDNLLTGSIPEEVYSLTELLKFYVPNNLLSGSLSTGIGSLKGLSSLDVSGNPLGGSIPSQIGLLKSIFLGMQKTGIRGTIPEELYQNMNLQELLLNGCNISGTISTRIGQLKKITSFQVADNNLHGTIPIELSSSKMLRYLHLNGNPYLSGSIPDELCARVTVLHTIMADCTPTESRGIPAIFCPKGCCSTCCDAETRICKSNSPRVGPSMNRRM